MKKLILCIPLIFFIPKISAQADASIDSNDGLNSLYFIVAGVLLLLALISYKSRADYFTAANNLNKKITEENDKSEIKLIASIVGIISYFVFAWIIKDILFSLDKEGTFKVYDIEILSAFISTIVTSILVLLIKRFDINNIINAYLFQLSIILALFQIFIANTPISVGIVMLMNILNIGFILYMAIGAKKLKVVNN